MDRVVVKNLIIISAILGVILGTLGAVPYIGIWLFIFAILFSAPVTMVYLIMDSKLDLTTIQNSIITGAITGFCSCIFFSCAYSILTAIIFNFAHYSNNKILTSIIINSPMWLLAVFIIFIAVVSATVNAFSGLATYYIINYIRDMYEKNHPQDEQMPKL